MAKQHNGTRRKAARINDVSPEVAVQLAGLARQMRELVFDGDGVPEWGTKFSEIESQAMQVGLELARLFMEQAVEEQADRVPDAALECDGEAAEKTDDSKTATLETAAGEVQWEQTRTRLEKSQRAFFPSGQGVGDQHR